MQHINIATLLFILLCVRNSLSFFDPVTIGIGAGLGYGAMNFNYIKKQTYCRWTECCDELSIPGDVNNLKENLTRHLFGQHIVVQQLIPALKAHFSAHSTSRKPLVISFHGTPGTGKNFVADKIAEALYTKGLQSNYVHKYLGRADFSLDNHADLYKARIRQEVREAITSCPRSLFIFDEVDKMPPGVFESLTSLLDYNSLVDRQDYTKAVFIFLSNTAGRQISDRLATLLKDGNLREESKLSDFEQILTKTAFNEDGGMKRTSLIASHVIDHYLPFLPLEKEHVRKCLEAEFSRWGYEPNNGIVENIIKDSVTYDRNHGLFATSGCKTLEKKVAVHVMTPQELH